MAELNRDVALMGRVADDKRTVTVPLGPCTCPGGIHPDGDSAQVRAEIGDGELRAATTRGGFRSGRIFNGSESDDATIAAFVLSWTLLDPDGTPYPIDPDVASRLDEATRTMLLGAINAASGRSVLLAKADVDALVTSLDEQGLVPSHELLMGFDMLIAAGRVLPNSSSGRSRGSSRATASQSRARRKS